MKILPVWAEWVATGYLLLVLLVFVSCILVLVRSRR